MKAEGFVPSAGIKSFLRDSKWTTTTPFRSIMALEMTGRAFLGLQHVWLLGGAAFDIACCLQMLFG